MNWCCSRLKNLLQNLRQVLISCPQFLIVLALTPLIVTAQALHPLDPLTEDEIRTTAKLLTSWPQFPQGALFSTIVLKEPTKQEILSYAPGAAFSRNAFAVILDQKRNRTFESMVDLRVERVLSWTEVPDVQPAALEAEDEPLSRIVMADPRWQAAMRKRGIADFSKVQIEAWALGQVVAAPRKGRLLRALSYYKGDSINFYGRPIEGVVALVNMNKQQVVEVMDTGLVPLAPPGQELDEKSTGTRPRPRPLGIAQPEGASFEIHGQEVRWQKWRFRYTMHPREGLVLHSVGYEDAGRLRPILYRASLSEMVVPYGDVNPNWRWRSAFDVGEWGLGRLAGSIEPKTDAPENATLIDATFAGDDGTPYTLPRAVGIYERDGGLLWKHYEGYSQHNESRRARQLVIFFIATIGNYDYALNWVFNQDGALEVDLALTGIMLPKSVREVKVSDHRGRDRSGHLVSANIVAPHHQHFFSFRLDFDVDGPDNSVHEMNTRALPSGRTNPGLNGMIMEESLLRSEREAQRQMNMQSARIWAVLNSSVRNQLGENTSYILVPGTNSLPYVAPQSQVRRRAGFINHHFWVTRFNPAEMYAAGAYPNQSRGGEGLPRWVANNEPLVNHDLVVWYTLGVTHIPRPEEWPIMPASHAGFKMIPGGFFSRNPALDVPR
jgi:primary-amine oxidase